VAVQQLGDADLGGLEIAALNLHHYIEDAVALSAGAPGLGVLLVPPPGSVVVRVVLVRADDVWSASPPAHHTDSVQHGGLVADDGLPDQGGCNEAGFRGHWPAFWIMPINPEIGVRSLSAAGLSVAS
jgi:hypothetical protein